MHLTTEEVALAGVVIGGLIGSFSGSLRDRTSQRREHRTRIWEKEIEIYESLLLVVLDMRQIRRDIRWKFNSIGDGKVDLPMGVLDEDARTRLPIQLDMFGRTEIRAAYDECTRLAKETVIALAKVNILLDDVGEVEADNLTEKQESLREEAIRCQAHLFKVLDGGDEADRYLTEVIAAAVQRAPTARRNRPRRVFGPRNLPTSAVKAELTRDL